MFRETSAAGYLLFLSLLGSFALPENVVRGQTPQECLDLYEGSVQAIKSFDLIVNGIYRSYVIAKTEMQKVGNLEHPVVTGKRKLLPNESPQTLQVCNRQIYRKGKGRIEFLNGPKGAPKNFLVYDGETEKGWTPSQHTATIARLNITPAGPDGTDYREGYMTIVGHTPYLKAFRDRGNTRVERKDEGNLVTLHSDPVTKPKPSIAFPNWGLRVTLDSQHGFMPVVLETFQKIDGKLMPYASRTVTNWKDLGGGVWVPTRVVSQHFDQDPRFPETFGQVSSEFVMEVDLDHSSWNQEIPEDTFKLALPKGTTVIDHLRNVRYVTGEDDPGKNLDALASHAQDVVDMHTLRPLPNNPWLLRTLIGGPILLLALIGFLVFVRRRRKIAGV